jgi:hypothetical protein
MVRSLVQPIEIAQNGNGQTLSRVGIAIGFAPHPLGAGASSALRGRPARDKVNHLLLMSVVAQVALH